MRPRPVLLTLVLAAVAALSACGQGQTADTDAFEGAEKDVAQAVYDFRDAVARRDEAKVCDSFLTEEVRTAFVEKARAAGRGATCADAIEETLRAIDATDIEIPDDGIAISGGTATVEVETNLSQGEDPVDRLTLRDERGWRISALPAAS